MEEVILDLTMQNPQRYFLVILREVFLQGAGLRPLLPEYGVLAAIGIAALFLAGHFFQKRIG